MSRKTSRSRDQNLKETLPNAGRIALTAGSGTLLERLRRCGYHLRADCGGEGSCGRCRVRFRSPAPDPEVVEKIWFTPAEIANGWRLTCRHSEVAAELEYNPDWRLTFNLESSEPPPEGTEAGLAVDFGTTGLVAALVDMKDGRILLTARGYNPQRAWGADVMTRLVAARDSASLGQLQRVILGALSDAAGVLHRRSATRLKIHFDRALAVGNTAMIHLATGIPETTLSVFPFHSPLEGQSRIPVVWDSGTLNLAGPVQGFVGSDLLAVLRALDLHNLGSDPALVMDLGTNSEIALLAGGRYWVTSCAAGPAFEGGGISCGSAAGPGVAVDVLSESNGWLLLPNDGQPKTGLCGSALIALLAELIRGEKMNPSGKLSDGRKILLQEEPTLALTQKDVRSLQLAKGAIHTGIAVLARRAGLPLSEIHKIVITGAFARSLKQTDLQEIGLIPATAATVEFINDGALRGAALALADQGEPFADLRPRIRVVNLVDEEDFQDLFMAGLELKPMV